MTQVIDILRLQNNMREYIYFNLPKGKVQGRIQLFHQIKGGGVYKRLKVWAIHWWGSRGRSSCVSTFLHEVDYTKAVSKLMSICVLGERSDPMKKRTERGKNYVLGDCQPQLSIVLLLRP
jgi:hypothetical protein